MMNTRHKGNASPVPAEAPSLRKMPTIDHLGAIIKASLAAIPLVGGTLSSLVGDYLPRMKEKRLEEFTEELARRLARLTDRIQEDYLRSEEFSFLFDQCYRRVAESYHAESLEALRNVLVNSIISVDIAQDTKEEYMRIAGILRPPHLEILHFFTDPGNERFKLKVNLKGGYASRKVKGMVRQRCFPDANEGYITALLNLLEGNGLIFIPAQSTEERNRQRSLTKSDFFLGSIGELKKLLTPFGKAFWTFIQDPS